MLSAIVRNTAVPKLLWARQGRRTEPYRTTWADCQLTADTLRLQKQCVRTKEEILVQKKSSVIGGRRNFLTKMCDRRRQGYLPKLVTKINEMPTTFESLVVKRNCSGGPRPSPLWEFREANCFRDLIAKQQNENPRRTAVV